MLAMDPSKLSRGADGSFFWELLAGIPANERSGSVGIVHIRGALSHHKEDGGDSYESILERVSRAYEDDAHFALLCFDTPGGVVSGLNEHIAALRSLRRDRKRPLIGWINEMAASAGFALACACDELFCPRTAIVGSIGVVSTIVSQAAKDKADGLDIRLITSGARKGDGHVHVPIEDDAMAAESKRVEELARGFFGLVSDRRGLSVEKIRSYQASIYLGPEAQRKGLVDNGRASLPDLLGSLEARADARRKRTAAGNETDRRAKSPLDNGTPSGSLRLITARVDSTRPKELAAMPVALDILIKRAEAKLVDERDPHARASLALKLSNYLAAKKDADDEDDDEDDDDEDEKKKAKKAAAKAAGESAKKAEEAKQAKKAAEEARAAAEEEEEAKALLARAALPGGEQASAALAILEAATGQKGAAALGAGAGLISRLQKVEQALADTSARAVATEREALVARATRYVPARLVAAIANDVPALRALVAEAEKGAPMISTEEGDLIQPKAVIPGTEGGLSKEARAMIDSAVLATPAGMDPKAYREALVKGHIEAQSSTARDRLNGTAGRY